MAKDRHLHVRYARSTKVNGFFEAPLNLLSLTLKVSKFKTKQLFGVLVVRITLDFSYNLKGSMYIYIIFTYTFTIEID